MGEFQILKQSPLKQIHASLKAEMFNRESWELVRRYGSGVNVESFQVGLADVGALGKLELHSPQAETLLESHFNQKLSPLGNSTSIGELAILKLRPDRFLILCPIGSEETLLAELRQSATAKNLYVPMVNQSSGYGIIRLTGNKASQVMSKLCAIDLRPNKTENLKVVQTSVAKIHATIARHDLGTNLSFDILVARYNAVYLWECLIDAGQEYNIQPFGWDDMDTISNSINGIES